MRKNSLIQRTTTGRALTKKKAARHLIHAAIRMTMLAEDPFAIHLLVQSAHKIIVDVSKNTKRALAFHIDDWIHEDARQAFREVYNELYNYLKHADRDHDKEVPVADIVGGNFLGLLLCAVNYHHVFDENTAHMNQFTIFATTVMPDIIITNDTQKSAIAEARTLIGDMTVRAYLQLIYDNLRTVMPKMLTERAEDLKDTTPFYDKTVREFERSPD